MSSGLHVVPRPPRAPDDQPSEAFLREAVEFWQARSGRKVSREDARQITENLTGFFSVLERWRKTAPVTVTAMDCDGKERAA